MLQSIQNVEVVLGAGQGGMYVPRLFSKPVVLLSQFHIFVSFVAILLSYVNVSGPCHLSEFYLTINRLLP